MVAQGLRLAVASASASDRRKLVWGAAALLISIQLGFRAWALYPSWFFVDDYRLMLDARSSARPNLQYLVSPFDSQFMPGGRLIAWIVTAAGPTNWTLAASLTLLLQLFASRACFWMLTTLFGERFSTLALMALYLSTAIGMPALMWWAASLNQLPMQTAFFLSVGLAVKYLRERRAAWLVGAASSIGLGLAFYVKTVLLGPTLAFIALLFFASGGWRERVQTVAREYWPALVVGATLGITFGAYYLTSVPQAFEGKGGEGKSSGVADAMLGTALPAGVVGGPWRWFETSPPLVVAAPPTWTVHVAWALLVLLIAYSVLRYERAWRGWVLIGGYAAMLFLLLVTTRGQLYGAFAGLEYRYLTDIVCVLPLGLGLAFLRLQGAVEPIRPRIPQLLGVALGPIAITAIVVIVCAGGVFSSLKYIDYWHNNNAGRDYVKNIQGGLREANGTVDLAVQIVPGNVMPEYTEPANRTDRFVGLLAGNARFPAASGDLKVLTPEGRIEQAVIKAGYLSTPGPTPDCGRKLVGGSTVIPLNGTPFPRSWWLRIGYLASADSPVTIEAGEQVVQTRIRRGPHSLFVRMEGTFNSVEISGLARDAVVCIDTIEVGEPVPGGIAK